MRQMKVWSQFLFNSDTVGRVLLEARAGQVPHIYGYRLELHAEDTADYEDSSDAVQVQLWLQAAPRAPLVSGGVAFSTTTLDAYMNNRSIIGYLGAAQGISGIANASGGHLPAGPMTPWMPCDFDVPGLWLVGSQVNTGNTRVFTSVIHVLFEWVDRSPTQVAALYTSYGIDAVDSQEKEAVGNINFNLTTGGGPLVGGVLG